jgi:hypothetical protein
MGAVGTLCNRCLLIEEGKVEHDGKVADVISAYQSRLYPAVAPTSELGKVDRYGSGKAKFTSVGITHLGPERSEKPFLYPGEDLLVDITIAGESDITDANVALIIYDYSGYRIIDTNTAIKGSFLSLQRGEEAKVQFQLHEVLLKPGTYVVGLWLGGNGEIIDGITYAASFSVEADPETIRHSETFPGTYQCKYSYELQIDKLPQNGSRIVNSD